MYHAGPMPCGYGVRNYTGDCIATPHSQGENATLSKREPTLLCNFFEGLPVFFVVEVEAATIRHRKSTKKKANRQTIRQIFFTRDL